MDSNAVKTQWVLITGGTRGIGRGLVTAFCAAGYDVVFTYQRSHEAAAELVREMAATGARAAGHCCDSADEEAVNALARGLLVERGAPHAVVNNVGITRDGAWRLGDGAKLTLHANFAKEAQAVDVAPEGRLLFSTAPSIPSGAIPPLSAAFYLA